MKSLLLLFLKIQGFEKNLVIPNKYYLWFIGSKLSYYYRAKLHGQGFGENVWKNGQNFGKGFLKHFEICYTGRVRMQVIISLGHQYGKL